MSKLLSRLRSIPHMRQPLVPNLLDFLLNIDFVGSAVRFGKHGLIKFVLHICHAIVLLELVPLFVLE